MKEKKIINVSIGTKWFQKINDSFYHLNQTDFPKLKEE